ncbi:TPA: ead/Ea22-like family protein [Escherichia coli]
MSMTTELAQRMKAAALKATQGEWWSDVVETDGEYGDGDDRESGYHSYAVYDAQGRSLLDMTNSTAATIQTEWDHDYHMAWDVVGEHNAKHIIASQPQNILALVEALEKEKGYASAYEAEKWHYHGLAESEGERATLAEARLEAALKRIAELEARTVKLPGTGGFESTAEQSLKDWADGWKAYREEAIRVLTAAGVAVEGE